MVGLSRVLSGLKASEEALRITSNNLTNANTKGYKRQRLIQTEAVSTGNGVQFSGLGVSVDSIQQIYNSLKEEVYQQSLAKLGEYDVKDRIYDYIQTLTGTTEIDSENVEGGLFRESMENMWTAANALSTDSASLTYRIAFRESAFAFLEQAETMMNQLSALQAEINEEIKGSVKQINEYAEQIHELNKTIAYYDTMGFDSNEAKDARDYAIEQLSKIVEVEVETCRETTALAVRIGGGYLVSESKVYPVELGQAQEGSIYDIPIWSNSGARLDIKSGSLKGLLDARGYDIVANLEDASNGSPKEKADIVISIDPSMSQEKLDNITNNIFSMLNSLDTYQSDYKLHLNIMGTNTNISFDNREEFENYLTNFGVGGTDDILASINSFEDIEFRENSNKYLMVFSDDAINGGATLDEEILDESIKKLKKLDMRVIAVTDNTNESNITSWNQLINETDGSIYDIADIENVEDFSNMGVDLVRNINARLNENDYTSIIPSVKAQINSFVNALAREMNAIFREGVNEYGEANTDGSLDMFIKIDNDLPWQVGNIKLNPAYEDINKMPLSTTGAVGDNTIAELITELRNVTMFADANNNYTIDGYYGDFVLDLGKNASEVLANLENQETIVNDADAKRTAISGVSIDEELSNIIKYQYAYGASSKMINVVDEMLELIVNLI